MNADLCDICGKPIESKSSFLTGNIKEQYIVKIREIQQGYSLRGYFKSTRKLDVCPDCMNKFMEFAKEGGVK